MSTTIAPAAATRGAYLSELGLPLLNKAMSRPEKSAVSVSSTTTSRSPQGSTVPVDRADAKNRISSTGK